MKQAYIITTLLWWHGMALRVRDQHDSPSLDYQHCNSSSIYIGGYQVTYEEMRQELDSEYIGRAIAMFNTNDWYKISEWIAHMCVVFEDGENGRYCDE